MSVHGFKDASPVRAVPADPRLPHHEVGGDEPEVARVYRLFRVVRQHPVVILFEKEEVLQMPVAMFNALVEATLRLNGMAQGTEAVDTAEKNFGEAAS